MRRTLPDKKQDARWSRHVDGRKPISFRRPLDIVTLLYPKLYFPVNPLLLKHFCQNVIYWSAPLLPIFLCVCFYMCVYV